MIAEFIEMLATAVTCLLLVAILVAALLLNYGIIWHERNSPEVKRTLINRLNSNLSRFSITYSCIVINLSLTVTLRDGMPVWFCNAQAFVMHGLERYFFVTIALDVVLRYLYIVVLKRVGVLNDDLLFVFITAATLSLTFYSSALTWFTGKHMGGLWHKCASNCLLTEGPAPSRANQTIYMVCNRTAFVIYVVLSTRIWWHKRKEAANVPQKGVEVHLTGAAISKESFVDLKTAVFALAFMITGNLIAGGMKTLHTDSAAAGDPFCTPWVIVAIVAIESIGIKSIYYIRNADMRKKVLKMYYARLIGIY